MGNIADPFRVILEGVHLPQKALIALRGVIPPGGINGQQGDLLFLQIGKGRYSLQIRIHIRVGLQVGADQVVALHIDICPTVANNILQIAEHLVGDLLHLVQALFIDKIFDIGPAQDKKANDYRKTGEDASQKDAAVFFILPHVAAPFRSMRRLHGSASQRSRKTPWQRPCR